jgi:hypothetical protein
MQSFMGKVNFVRRFISDFAEIVKPLQEMIKKDANFKWTNERKEAFRKIKEAIVEDPTLWSPYFDREFILYTFDSDHSIATMLTQKDEVGEEFLVSFMSTGLQGSKLNYPTIDKQPGTLNMVMMLRCKNCITSLSFITFKGIASVHLEK